ncbi:hypothetical protein MMC22_004177 [Lobaria immixta]|nr:hypothetical protein [Lobaria immixta]
MASIAYCTPPNLEAYDILVAHLATDVWLRTPRAPRRKHTLLHIIYLPLDDTQLNVFARSIFRSVHHVRTLSSTWRPTRLRATCPLLHRPGQPVNLIQRTAEDPLLLTPQSTSFFAAQLEVATYVLDLCSSSIISTTDAYGNSALHYLAAYQIPNQELIAYLRAREQQECVDLNTWKEARNTWGYTAEELCQDSQTAVKGRHMAFWEDRDGSDDGGEGSLGINPCFGCGRMRGGGRGGRSRGAA